MVHSQPKCKFFIKTGIYMKDKEWEATIVNRIWKNAASECLAVYICLDAILARIWRR